jgi:hypothetical protein
MGDTLGHKHPFKLADLERAYAMLAYVVINHGDAYLPLLDRMEREIVHARRAQSGIERARQVLETYTLDGGMKAIR